MPEKELKLSPSAAERWLSCQGSPALIAKTDLPEEESSPYAEEGIIAHKHAEEILNGKIERDKARPGLTEEGREHVLSYVDFVSRYRKDGFDILVEESAPVFYREEKNGYVDFAAIAQDGSAVTICDLKFGAGVSVEARENPQQIIYAWSLLEVYSALYPFTEETLVNIVIFQPRVRGEEAVRLWSVRMGELRQHAEAIGEVAASILDGSFEHPLKPSESACRFCPVAPVCQARAAYLLGDLAPEGESIIAPGFEFPESADVLSVEKVARIVERKKEIIKWLETCEGHLQALLKGGEPVPGFKLVEAQTKRRWDDEEAARAWLLKRFKKAEVVKESIVSPAQVEKLLKAQTKVRKTTWEEFSGHVVKPSGAETIAPESDKRPPVQPLNAADEFDVL